jgi:hypothetical protein
MIFLLIDGSPKKNDIVSWKKSVPNGRNGLRGRFTPMHRACIRRLHCYLLILNEGTSARFNNQNNHRSFPIDIQIAAINLKYDKLRERKCRFM